jgi:hypothetical protein
MGGWRGIACVLVLGCRERTTGWGASKTEIAQVAIRSCIFYLVIVVICRKGSCPMAD